MGRLIIDDTTIYEIDEECMQHREKKENSGNSSRKHMRDRSGSSIADSVKERPAL